MEPDRAPAAEDDNLELDALIRAMERDLEEMTASSGAQEPLELPQVSHLSPRASPWLTPFPGLRSQRDGCERRTP